MGQYVSIITSVHSIDFGNTCLINIYVFDMGVGGKSRVECGIVPQTRCLICIKFNDLASVKKNNLLMLRCIGNVPCDLKKALVQQ